MRRFIEDAAGLVSLLGGFAAVIYVLPLLISAVGR